MSVNKTSSGSWKANVYDRSTDRRLTKTFKSKRDAQDWETSMKAKFNSGRLSDPRAGKMTFGAYAQVYLDARPNLAPNTRWGYENHLARLMPLWGNRKLSSLVASDAVRLEADLMAAHTGHGARNSLILARTICNAAYRDRIIERSPFEGVKLKKPRNRREVILPTWQQVRAVVEGRTSRTPVRMTVRQTLIAVMAGSGLRAAEVLGLTADSVDFLRRDITVKRTVNYLSDSNAQRAGYARGGHYVKEAKSDAGQGRVVPVAQWTLDILAAWLAENPPAVVDIPRDRPDAPVSVPLAPLFGLIRNDSASALVRDAKWPTKEKFSPHDLRKLFATELEQRGLPYTSLQAILGHASVSVTGLYVHVTEASLDQARDILTAAWDGASGTTAGCRPDDEGIQTG